MWWATVLGASGLSRVAAWGFTGGWGGGGAVAGVGVS